MTDSKKIYTGRSEERIKNYTLSASAAYRCAVLQRLAENAGFIANRVRQPSFPTEQGAVFAWNQSV